jgi:hypothetical protein
MQTPRLIAAVFLICAAAPLLAQECEKTFDSTFDLIQEVVFENKGCTSVTCHSGPLPAAGLDLTAGNSFDNLIDQPVQSVAATGGLRRVVPINKGNSLLWLNLAAAVLPDEWRAPLQPMPIGGFPPLSFAELELVRMWIEYGATRNGVVPGTGELVDACTGPPGRLEVEPLPPPAPGDGIQLRAPHQVLPPLSERETCFVSYYDVRDQVPPESLTADGTRFRYKRVEPRQDPLSHHAVVILYEGSAPISSPVWGAFACRGGSMDGSPCNPRNTTFCGADSVCGSPPVSSLACIGYGPGDASIGTGEASLFNTMASSAAETDGIFAEAPVEGILVWNSHAFNVSAEPAKLDIWVNVLFARASEQRHQLRRFVDISQIAKMRPPAYGADEVCHHKLVDDGAQLLDITSHTHKRGKRFQVFEGRFACNGGPNSGAACTPFGPDPDFPVADICAGAPCQSRRTPRVGDCNRDLTIEIGELITGVGIALAERPLADCARFDGNADGRVAIGELITAVDSALAPPLRDASQSLLYTTLTYADPLVLQFVPPRYLAPRGSTAEERTLTFCALYDNGFVDANEVKRRSTSPDRSTCQPTHCAEGRGGAPCSGGNQSQRDRSCDSESGGGDGFCDACPASFGVTTDDEMFVLTGSFYVP